MPAIGKSFPAHKALKLDYEILPVVNSKKQLLGVVFRRDLEQIIEENQTNSPRVTNRNLETKRQETSPHRSKDWEKERTLLLRSLGLITYCNRMMELVDLCIRVAKVDSTVLISGESGVGKELIAKLIHDQSPRSQNAFIKINCGAIPDNLIESELFGYESGAFTGASRQGKMGMFELAHEGTLFLDEIGEIPLSLQVKLLRAIQEQEFVPVGGTKARRVNIRFIAATNRDLEEMVEEGRFREDLYFRLNVIPLHVPPLRERREDILPLIHHFQAKFTERFKIEKTFAPETLRAFVNYCWPGNVRELENVVERMFVIYPDETIRYHHLPDKVRTGKRKNTIKITGLMPLREAIDELQLLLIEEALTTCGNTYKAAEALQIDPSTITRKLSRLKERKL